MGCGLGWFVGPKFSLSDGLGWVSRLVGWVEEIGPTDNSAIVHATGCREGHVCHGTSRDMVGWDTI